MVKILFFLSGLLLFPFGAKAASDCTANGATLIAGRCVYAASGVLDQDSMQSNCAAFSDPADNGMLVRFDTEEFFDAFMAEPGFGDSIDGGGAWIGGISDGNDNFSWMPDTTPFTFTNWAATFPISPESGAIIQRVKIMPGGEWETEINTGSNTLGQAFCQYDYEEPPPNITMSGAIVLFHSACNTFEVDGSGAVLACSQWDTSIEIPAVAALNRQIAYIGFAVVIFVLKLCMYGFILGVVGRWLFRIVTGYRPNRYRRPYARRA